MTKSDAASVLRWQIGSAVLAGWLAIAPAHTAHSQTEAAPTPAPTEATPDPRASEEARARIAEIEAEIARLTTSSEEWAARTAEFRQARESAPEVLARLESEVAELQRGEPPDVGDGRMPEELETELIGQEQDLVLARKASAALNAEATLRTERRKQIPELLANAKERLLAQGPEVAIPPSEPALLEVRQRLAEARRQAIESEIAAYEEELRSYEARGQLLAVRLEHSALRISVLEARVSALREALATQRQGEAEDAAREAWLSLEIAESMPPAVLAAARRLAAENRELALRRTGPDGLLQGIEETDVKLTRADQMVAEVTADLDLLRRSVEAGGLSGSVGLLLRKVRAEVPDVGMYRRFIRMRRDQVNAVQNELVALAERREELDDVDLVVERELRALESSFTPEERDAVQELLRDLYTTQQRYLDTLIADTETWFQKLVDFDARQQELVNRTESLKRYIDERVLWMPSGEPLPGSFLSDAREGLAWALAPRYWGQLRRAFRASLEAAPVMFTIATLLLLALPFGGRLVRARVAEFGERARDPRCIEMRPTAAALVLSLLLALWGPGLLGFVGWRLGVSVDSTQFVRSIAAALLAAAFAWFSLAAPRQLLRSGGVATAHLGWPEPPTRDLRRGLGWLTAVVIPGVFVIALYEVRGEEEWRESLGRLAFVLTAGAVLVFTHRVLRRDAGALTRIFAMRTDAALPDWSWRVLHAAAVLGVFGVILGAARGYYWTALQLAVSFHVTLLFVVVVFFAHQLGGRWLLMASRRLALQRWREAQAERVEEVDSAQDVTVSSDEPELDLATVDEQTNRLLQNGALFAIALGVWLIWGDLLPAAGALRSVELWTTSTTATVETLNAAGERFTSVEDRIVPITLNDMLLALVLGFATVALVRNLPGLLEISLFRRLRTSPGERYAYTSIGKYGVTLLGAGAVFNAVGVGWSSIQWLVAAVGLGLGFGLQEIFANFVSGLIILFERPIRVGDTVTVGDVSGTVTRIRIRATWITSFDRKELVVPNKEFITGRLVNWSLSDAILRVELPVGIAYGSDTAKAHRVLEEVAKRNPNVMREPEPHALFRGFGDSSLNFVLRVFCPDASRYTRIVHDLHMEIDREFRAEGIEIAFPQRDIHVRSVTSDLPRLDPKAGD